jgi:hypothetical protein
MNIWILVHLNSAPLDVWKANMRRQPREVRPEEILERGRCELSSARIESPVPSLVPFPVEF